MLSCTSIVRRSVRKTTPACPELRDHSTSSVSTSRNRTVITHQACSIHSPSRARRLKETTTSMSQKRKRSASPVSTRKDEPSSQTPAIFRSTKIEDRQSVFLGLYSPSLTPKQLQGLAEIASASHKILGWRRESNQQSLTAARQHVAGHDDDGERYGGRKVEQVLVGADVVGACVVARWYGGTMLGPVRFSHIEGCAREAVRLWQDSVAEERLERRRVEDEAIEKKRMVMTLVARDRSIAVLRTLAVEKEEALKPSRGSQSDNPGLDNVITVGEGIIIGPERSQSQVNTAAPAPDYDSMQLSRLRSLEKARDATLSFLLKRIDKAEANLKALAEPNPPADEPP